jgi:hypothetical protein
LTSFLAQSVFTHDNVFQTVSIGQLFLRNDESKYGQQKLDQGSARRPAQRRRRGCKRPVKIPTS